MMIKKKIAWIVGIVIMWLLFPFLIVVAAKFQQLLVYLCSSSMSPDMANLIFFMVITALLILVFIGAFALTIYVMTEMIWE